MPCCGNPECDGVRVFVCVCMCVCVYLASHALTASAIFVLQLVSRHNQALAFRTCVLRFVCACVCVLSRVHPISNRVTLYCRLYNSFLQTMHVPLLHIHTHTYMYVRTYACLYVGVCVCVCVCVYTPATSRTNYQYLESIVTARYSSQCVCVCMRVYVHACVRVRMR